MAGEWGHKCDRRGGEELEEGRWDNYYSFRAVFDSCADNLKQSEIFPPL